MTIAGVSAYAITALIAEANLRTGTVSRTPLEAIEKSVATLRTDRRLRDGTAKRLFPGTSKLDDEQVARPLLERPH